MDSNYRPECLVRFSDSVALDVNQSAAVVADEVRLMVLERLMLERPHGEYTDMWQGIVSEYYELKAKLGR